MKKLPILYHGTDARMVRMSEEQRSEYKKNCMLVIDYLWPFYNVGFLKIIHLFGNDYMSQHPLFSKALNCLGGYKNGNQQYQYGSFCLTNSRQRAMAYAYNSFAGGEMGMMVYELYRGAEWIGFEGWNPDEEVRYAASKVLGFAEEQHEPVLFAITDYDPRLLKQDNGHALAEGELEWLADGTVQASFRYAGDITLDLRQAIKV